MKSISIGVLSVLLFALLYETAMAEDAVPYNVPYNNDNIFDNSFDNIFDAAAPYNNDNSFDNVFDARPAKTGIGVLTITPGETMPYMVGVSPDYAATYIGAGGVSSRTQTTVVSNVGARINYGSFKDMQPGEILVLHMWGNKADGTGTENCIVAGVNPSNNANVDFTIYISTYANPWVRTLTLPAAQAFDVSIQTLRPTGTSYKKLEFRVDPSNGRSYRYQYTVPQQYMDGADIALEKKYNEGEQRPGPTIPWRTIGQFRCYDQNNKRIDLKKSGYALEWKTDGVDTAYYHDYTNTGATNGMATVYMTRYNTSMAYPAHP